MKNNNIFWIVMVGVMMLIQSCEPGCEEKCKNGRCNGESCFCDKDYTGEWCDSKCYSTPFYGAQGCSANYLAVSSTKCCPKTNPYWCSSTGVCYESCDDAKKSECSGTVVFGTGQTSGGGGGGGNCNYTSYTGSNGCSSGNVQVTSSVCCPGNAPYYCSQTNQCFASCEVADIECSGTIILGSSTGGGGTCNYSNWTGSGSCNSGYIPVSSTKCCPSGTPYWCASTGICYTTCDQAKGTSCVTIVKANPNGNTGGTCNYSNYTGTGNCSSGAIPVSSSKCCSSSYPYWCASSGTCYATCEGAKNSSNCGGIVKGNPNGNTGGTTCNYTQWTGTANCGIGYAAVSSNKCCPTHSPFWCSTQNSCYSTCSNAKSSCSGTIYRANI